MHAVAPDLLVCNNVAALGEIPRRAVVDARGVDGIGRGLDVDAVGPEAHEGDVEDEGEDGEEDFEEPEGGLDEVEEHAYYADDEVVLRVAGNVSVEFDLDVVDVCM